MKQTRTFIIVTICTLLVSCNSIDNSPAVSFYYWRTVFELSDYERHTLIDNNVYKLYVRYFDIDLDNSGTAFPESPIRFKDNPEKLKVVPVVYIKNKVMLNDSLNIDKLASNIINYIEQINLTYGINNIEEIQIDCDWTLNSRDTFMKFIEVFKQKNNKKLSATIRLHQIKYYVKTSIPNVDNAVLMYYNIGKIAPDTLNSIYDPSIAEQYIKSLKSYPLKLNIALPIYTWGVHIRNNKVINLISKTNQTTFENDTNYIVSDNKNIITVKNSNIKLGNYFLRNDKIKIEQVTKADLLQMSKAISKHLKYTPEEIIFFDLDEINLNKFKNEKKFYKYISHRF